MVRDGMVRDGDAFEANLKCTITYLPYPNMVKNPAISGQRPGIAGYKDGARTARLHTLNLQVLKNKPYSHAD